MTSGRYIPELDGLRAVALAMVVLFHAEVILNAVVGFSRIAYPFGAVRRVPGRLPPVDAFSRVLLQGYFGIYLFFILSGFILAVPFLDRSGKGPPVDFRRFYLRRLTRLQAPYALALTIFVVVSLVVGGIGTMAMLRHYGASLVYLHGALIGGVNPANGPLWTMEVEIQFYVLLPLLASAFLLKLAIARRLAILTAAVLAILWQAYLPPDSSFFYVSIGFFLQFFLAGFFLADVYVSHWRDGPARRRAWDAVTLVGWPLFFVLAIWGTKPFDQGLLPWVAVLLFAAALRGELTGRFLSSRWLAGLGAASFSIYLVHYPLLILIARAMRPVLPGSHHLAWLAMLGVAAPAVVAAGLVFFRYVERPCMDPAWPAKLLSTIRRPGGGRARARAVT